MTQALRLTDRTKFKIAKQLNASIDDIQAMMETYSSGIMRPYAVLYNSPEDIVEGESIKWWVLSNHRFQSVYKFVDEEDPCMFTEVRMIQ